MRQVKNATFLTKISIIPDLDYCKRIDYDEYVMKDLELQMIAALAREYGFDDARFAPWDSGSVLVLFSAYRPAQIAGGDRIYVSAYYIASNRAYENAGLLAEKLNGMGIAAKRDSSLPAKKIALLTGGCIGKNGFYYHPELGSLVHIQTIALAAPYEGEAAEPKICADCGRCAQACPAGAITEEGVDYTRCVRNHMNGRIPDDLKPFVYQLYGCEKCQTACPKNTVLGGDGCSFDLKETVQGLSLPEIQKLAGKNMARFMRTVNQSILIAANAGNTAVRQSVEALSGDQRFEDACRYYREKTGKKD